MSKELDAITTGLAARKQAALVASMSETLPARVSSYFEQQAAKARWIDAITAGADTESKNRARADADKKRARCVELGATATALSRQIKQLRRELLLIEKML